MPPDHTDDGLRAAIQIRAAEPGTSVLVLSQFLEDRYVFDLVTGGAPGYRLPAQGESRQPEPAHRGHPPGRLRRVGPRSRRGRPPGGPQTASRSPRRPHSRELEVLSLMAEGRSNAGIAQELPVTVAAVERNVTRIFDKLGIHQSPCQHRRILAVLKYLQA